MHEGTLVHAVSILALWCSRLTAEVPKKLTDWFKKVFSLKTSTSAVRHAYLQCMLASFRGEPPCPRPQGSLPDSTAGTTSLVGKEPTTRTCCTEIADLKCPMLSM